MLVFVIELMSSAFIVTLQLNNVFLDWLFLLLLLLLWVWPLQMIMRLVFVIGRGKNIMTRVDVEQTHQSYKMAPAHVN